METYKLKFTRLQNEIFRMLSMNAGKRFNQSELAKMLKVSPTAIAKALPLLEKEELAKVEKVGNINLNHVSFNRDSEKAVFFKKTENLKILYETNLISVLYNSLPGSTIILFGSYSKGEDTTQSDIDIAVIGYKNKNLDVSGYERNLMHKINISYYESWQKIHKNLKNNILNGITLSGAVEL